jgi:hypothetical protein
MWPWWAPPKCRAANRAGGQSWGNGQTAPSEHAHVRGVPQTGRPVGVRILCFTCSAERQGKAATIRDRWSGWPAGERRVVFGVLSEHLPAAGRRLAIGWRLSQPPSRPRQATPSTRSAAPAPTAPVDAPTRSPTRHRSAPAWRRSARHERAHRPPARRAHSSARRWPARGAPRMAWRRLTERCVRCCSWTQSTGNRKPVCVSKRHTGKGAKEL